jgi:hypothetical protein
METPTIQPLLCIQSAAVNALVRNRGRNPERDFFAFECHPGGHIEPRSVLVTPSKSLDWIQRVGDTVSAGNGFLM